MSLGFHFPKVNIIIHNKGVGSYAKQKRGLLFSTTIWKDETILLPI